MGRTSQQDLGYVLTRINQILGGLGRILQACSPRPPVRGLRVADFRAVARVVETRDLGKFAAARTAALRLGWQTSWTETVLSECLAVLLAWHGGHVNDLTSEVVDAIDAELAACSTIPPSSRRAYRNRLAGVRQLLFETRAIDTPPRRRP